jgi:hypothetical protein
MLREEASVFACNYVACSDEQNLCCSPWRRWLALRLWPRGTYRSTLLVLPCTRSIFLASVIHLRMLSFGPCSAQAIKAASQIIPVGPNPALLISLRIESASSQALALVQVSAAALSMRQSILQPSPLARSKRDRQCSTSCASGDTRADPITEVSMGRSGENPASSHCAMRAAASALLPLRASAVIAAPYRGSVSSTPARCDVLICSSAPLQSPDLPLTCTSFKRDGIVVMGPTCRLR